MPERPNVLLIFTDQHRRDSLGCYGNEICRTPNLDRLAREGVTFENAYTTCPACTPARASLQTGLYPFGHGMQTNIFNRGCMLHELPDEPYLLSRRLQEAGYRPGYTGKWHLGYGKEARQDPYFRENYGYFDKALHSVDLPRGYRQTTSLPTTLGYEGDDFPGHGGGGHGYPLYRQWLEENGLTHEPYHGPGVGQVEVTSPPESTVAHFLTERTIHYLERMRDGDRPFCFSLHYWGPHGPAYVPTEYLDLYRDVSMPPWESFEEGQAHKPRIHEVRRNPRPWEEFEESLRFYYGFVSLIDHEIGRLLDYMDETGLSEDTLVLFSADHGDSMGVHAGLTDKAFFLYEETAAIPLLARPPGGLGEARRAEAFANTTDIYSTILDYAGDEESFEREDGRSLRPLIEGRRPEGWPGSVVTECSGLGSCLATQRMIRRGPYKYVFNGGDLEELYHLEEDPHEMTNLAVDPAWGEVLEEMQDALLEWMEEHGDGARGAFRSMRGRPRA